MPSTSRPPTLAPNTPSVEFDFVGYEQTYTVASSTGSSLTIQACGASGGSYLSNGGLGGCITCTISVSPNDVLYVNVGGSGGYYHGYNGGGYSYYGGYGG